MNSAKMAVLVALVGVTLGACSSVQESSATRNAEKGPAYTEEEKAQMTTEEKVAVYNDQQNEPDKLVCRRERPVGSRMIKTVCRTQAEIEQERQAAQDAMRPAKGYSQGAGD
jgi:hypothetical protein